MNLKSGLLICQGVLLGSFLPQIAPNNQETGLLLELAGAICKVSYDLHS